MLGRPGVTTELSLAVLELVLGGGPDICLPIERGSGVGLGSWGPMRALSIFSVIARGSETDIARGMIEYFALGGGGWFG